MELLPDCEWSSPNNSAGEQAVSALHDIALTSTELALHSTKSTAEDAQRICFAACACLVALVLAGLDDLKASQQYISSIETSDRVGTQSSDAGADSTHHDVAVTCAQQACAALSAVNNRLEHLRSTELSGSDQIGPTILLIQQARQGLKSSVFEADVDILAAVDELLLKTAEGSANK